ncbi:sulfotransferase 2B1-like [Spea bombifrons]|uniref:sulfotransferase 2B1-like n=1 Tax=Spea bombifrons TaxID=233779 RepID=UPI002349D161|nr:sulfotransferase 2B1-like [Spea bombifrons]
MASDLFTYKGIQFAKDIHSEEYLDYAENGFTVFDDDIFNVTYPKSGTNWMIEILNLIKYKGDISLSNQVPVYMRSPWYETVNSKEQIDALTRPRIISSHLPFHMFAKSFFNSKAKVIYTMRNPKDISVSNYHFAKILRAFKDPESFQKCLEDFLHGNAVYGSWFDHVKGWLQMKDDDRFFFITYEELLQDLRGCVVKISKFLGQELDDEAIDLVVKHSTFKSMKENKMSNWTMMPDDIIDHSKGCFLRKGVSGDWKNHFTVAQSEYFDSVYQENMKDFNFTFFWEEN